MAKLVRVLGPSFTAGMVVKNDRVVFAAPILRRMGVVGMTRAQVKEYFRMRGFSVDGVIDDPAMALA